MKLSTFIQQSKYAGYAYSYPHKLTYRTLEEPMSLTDVWKNESKKNLFFYVHVPFCESRCGFCNLFSVSAKEDKLKNQFFNALVRQMKATSEALEEGDFDNFAIGGGTPSVLSTSQLSQLFDKAKSIRHVDSSKIPTAIEVSPSTIDEEKVALLKSYQMTRVSMGVQSFVKEELDSIGRFANMKIIDQSIMLLKDASFPLLNLDLIYGVQNQTLKHWKYTLERTLEIGPEEIFLYPLYVRPLTGLGSNNHQINDFRDQFYDFARDLLLENGYEQLTMRQFKKVGAPSFIATTHSTVQSGMVGLGVGARSYTDSLHYSFDYAVGSCKSKEIIMDYNNRSHNDFQLVEYGFRLNEEEKKRRFLIKSLCEGRGIDCIAYKKSFSSSVNNDFQNELEQMFELGLINLNEHLIVLTPKGRAHEDVIGPWLYSDHVKQAMGSYSLV